MHHHLLKKDSLLETNIAHVAVILFPILEDKTLNVIKFTAHSYLIGFMNGKIWWFLDLFCFVEAHIHVSMTSTYTEPLDFHFAMHVSRLEKPHCPRGQCGLHLIHIQQTWELLTQFLLQSQQNLTLQNFTQQSVKFQSSFGFAFS